MTMKMSLRGSSLCRSSPHVLPLRSSSNVFLRHASTSTTESTPQPDRSLIPPEHPSFIHIAKPTQTQHIPQKSMKGVLPVPRKIFKKSDDMDKTSSEYLAYTTPEPFPRTKEPPPTAEGRDILAYKAANATLRRKNLREGLRSLKHRKDRTEARYRKIGSERTALHNAAVSAPERDDEYLSRATVMAHMLDPNVWRTQKEIDLPERKARYAARVAAKEDEKRNALHTLYMNAGEFIVTEEHMEKKVKEVFDEDKFYKKNPDMGIWDKSQVPEGVSDLLAMERGNYGSATEQATNQATELTAERLKRIAEEFTGGKM